MPNYSIRLYQIGDDTATKTPDVKGTGITGKTYKRTSMLTMDLKKIYDGDKVTCLNKSIRTEKIEETENGFDISIRIKATAGHTIDLIVLCEETDNDIFVVASIPIVSQKLDESITNIDLNIPKLVCV